MPQRSAGRKTRVEVPHRGAVTLVRTAPSGRAPGWTFVYAPGAGSALDDPFALHASRVLAESGTETVRFQFPYMEAGRRSPDRPDVLEATWRAVLDAVRRDAKRVVAGGRSMGGRIASQVVAEDGGVDALALFAYPLHPPGKADQLRVEHFGELRLPVLFCSGTRDAFAAPAELRAAARKVRRAKVHLLDGADHGFSVPKSSGRTREDVWDEAVGAMASWLRSL
jgi:uncharacterized protein